MQRYSRELKRAPVAKTTRRCDTAVIGGGLAGLTAASLLQEAGVDFLVLEASGQPGGRIDALRSAETGEVYGDLGPSWVWPPYQRNVQRWVNELRVATFPQYEQGDALMEVDSDAAPMRLAMPGQHGIARLTGGPSALIDALQQRAGSDRILCDRRVANVASDNGIFELSMQGEGSEKIEARTVIAAAPLRLMIETIDWNGLIGDPLKTVMRNAPTWMAAQAKAVVTFETPFWRENKLSGRVASRIGPMVEIHDHCGPDGHPAALFGFIGRPPSMRRSHDLTTALREQLVRCFGEQAKQLVALEIRDWAQRDNICSRYDLEGLPEHPRRLDDITRQMHGEGGLVFAVSETAAESPGLIDGAFEAGERAARQILQSLGR